ncbi:MAG: 4Fe-4S dicluster domain-containing protein [Candidatus Omnitrophota bacterium]|nr:4Fe-4S dicluster domain-containing protein [Candidatus Omnitrophota bacterium]
MMQKTITMKELSNILDSLSKGYEIVGPRKFSGKGVFYSAITDAGDLYLGTEFTVEPVKKLFLMPSEWLFENSFNDGKISLGAAPPQEKKKRIIIGVRPCEARGLELLDKVFCSDSKDSSYSKNRERSVIVGLACSKPDKTCFCTSLGSSPAETRGMDAMIFAGEDSDEMTLEILTDKAKDIFAPQGDLTGDERKKRIEAEKKRIKDSIRKINISDTLGDCFESGYWEDVSSSCVSCGVCTYLCPTCHCFDLVDEKRKKLRCYDGCCFKDFTRQASGENPRPTKKERYRQRVFHKFDYFRKNFGEHLCVGCGRCIRYCPVKIDISEIAANAPKKK